MPERRQQCTSEAFSQDKSLVIPLHPFLGSAEMELLRPSCLGASTLSGKNSVLKRPLSDPQDLLLNHGLASAHLGLEVIQTVKPTDLYVAQPVTVKLFVPHQRHALPEGLLEKDLIRQGPSLLTLSSLFSSSVSPAGILVPRDVTSKALRDPFWRQQRVVTQTLVVGAFDSVCTTVGTCASDYAYMIDKGVCKLKRIQKQVPFGREVLVPGIVVVDVDERAVRKATVSVSQIRGWAFVKRDPTEGIRRVR